MNNIGMRLMQGSVILLCWRVCIQWARGRERDVLTFFQEAANIRLQWSQGKTAGAADWGGDTRKGRPNDTEIETGVSYTMSHTHTHSPPHTHTHTHDVAWCMFYRRAREDLRAANLRINQMLADYGDVVPRREFEMIESSFRVSQTAHTHLWGGVFCIECASIGPLFLSNTIAQVNLWKHSFCITNYYMIITVFSLFVEPGDRVWSSQVPACSVDGGAQHTAGCAQDSADWARSVPRTTDESQENCHAKVMRTIVTHHITHTIYTTRSFDTNSFRIASL